MNSRQQNIDFHRNYCVHYDPRGSKDCCDLGIKAQAIPAQTPSADGKRLVPWGPCIGGHTLEDALKHCPRWEIRTLESAEKRADEIETAMKRMTVAAPFINAWRVKPPIGKREVVTCPVCQGRLHLSQASNNGHVMAQCETAECINFRE